MQITPYHAKYYAHELTKKNASDSIEKFSRTLADAQVDLNPHQIDAALFAFKSPLSRGAILADEVGLGKTIEAGILLSQKWAEGKRKVIIICPLSLRKQWESELEDKFFLKATVLDGTKYREEKKNKVLNPFDRNDIVICSYHFAHSKELNIAQVPWDLAIIDEAHKLRNVHHGSSSKIAHSLKKSLGDGPKVLLTATPLQNSLIELFGLVSYIDPHTFGDLKSFKTQFVRLSEEESPNYADLKERLQRICKRTLRKQVREYIRYTERLSLTQEYVPSAQEQELYDKITAYLQRDNLYSLPAGQRQLITLILRRLLASSTYAVSGTLEGFVKRLEDSLKYGVVKSATAYLSSLAEEMPDAEETLDELNVQDRRTRAITKDDIQGVRDEIAELKEYSSLGRSIASNAKGEALLTALEKGFEKLDGIGAPKKALIFTEFRRTQEYLFELLSNTKHAGRIVLFNGTNDSAMSSAIYQDWLKKNEGTDKVSGSKSSTIREALVDYFREDASIMIATEAAAEGINLQFCSLVVNYDLPWNPQRIEQRIGRCHRYGQQHDVVVINFLNTANEADKRVYELLDKKFKLFSGVFGASDDVLGTVESGIDFEKRIVQIYQQCRTAEEINQSFDELQKELEEQIQERMSNTKIKLLENFDEEVLEKLRVSMDKSEEYLNKFERLLWDVTMFELATIAEFDSSMNSFTLLKAPPLGVEVPLGRYRLGCKIEDAHLYRFGLPLTQHVLAQAKNRATPDATLLFDYTNHPKKISSVELLKGEEGILFLHKVRFSSFDDEEYLVFSAMTDGGIEISHETCVRFFDIGGQMDATGRCVPSDNLRKLCEQQIEGLKGVLSEKNERYYDEEISKLEKWGEDKKNTYLSEYMELEEDVKSKRKEKQKASSLKEKIDTTKEIRQLEEKRDNAWGHYQKEKRDVDRQIDELLDNISERMELRMESERVFALRWKVV